MTNRVNIFWGNTYVKPEFDNLLQTLQMTQIDVKSLSLSWYLSHILNQMFYWLIIYMHIYT